MSTFPERVASCALDHYKKAISKGKPKDGLEWTVYAAIVAHQGDQLWVVSSSTGTKCTANRKHGCILHDTHAEVLARRGLMRVLWLEIVGRENTSQRSLLERQDGDLFRLHPDLELHMYISDSPCGDASIYQVESGSKEEVLYTGAKVIVTEHTGIDAESCGGNHQLLKGTPVAREDTQILGKLRTKSGRSNLPAHLRSSSMSCSDKIVLWSILGLQGGLLSRLVGPVQLASIVVSEDSRLKKRETPDSSEQQKALQRAIPSRVQAVWDYVATSDSLSLEQKSLWSKKPAPSVAIVSNVYNSGKAAMAALSQSPNPSNNGSNVDGETTNSKKRKRGDEATVSPCGFALNWNHSDPAGTEIVVGARGIRQGKKPKSDDDFRNLSSRLSRRSLLGFYMEHDRRKNDGSDSHKRYQAVKGSACSPDWCSLKATILQGGPLVGWLRNVDEGDFDIADS